MTYTSILVVSMLLFILCLLVFVYALRELLILPDVIQPPVIIDPGLVACSEDDVLTAYIFGYPQKVGCPPWVNNYMVDKEYILNERNFVVQQECCYYSSEENARQPVEYPWICVGNSTGLIYSVQTLNQNPYISNGIEVIYTVPACSGSAGCISLIYAGLREENAVYKVQNYEGYEVITDPQGPESLYLQMLGLDFHVGGHCAQLEEVYYIGELIGHRENNTFVWDIPVEDVPSMAMNVVGIFMNDGFRPIAGANPTATEIASELVSS